MEIICTLYTVFECYVKIVYTLQSVYRCLNIYKSCIRILYNVYMYLNTAWKLCIYCIVWWIYKIWTLIINKINIFLKFINEFITYFRHKYKKKYMNDVTLLKICRLWCHFRQNTNTFLVTMTQFTGRNYIVKFQSCEIIFD